MIAKEGFPFIISAAVLLIVLIFVPVSVLITLTVALLLLFIWFFRDPERDIPPYDGIAVSGADGRIVEIVSDSIEGEEFYRVSVFMNVFDVHVNRAPVAGEIVSVTHMPGKFMAADKPEATMQNEQNVILMKTAYGNVVVKQVAGMLARRTVCFGSPGDKFAVGERIGIIKFSSRVDHYLPKTFDIVANVGDNVTAGETVIAKYQG